MRFLFQILLMSSAMLVFSACGVKKDPLPPALPAEIGKGRPLFQGDPDNKPSLQQYRDYPDLEQKDDQPAEE